MESLTSDGSHPIKDIADELWINESNGCKTVAPANCQKKRKLYRDDPCNDSFAASWTRPLLRPLRIFSFTRKRKYVYVNRLCGYRFKSFSSLTREVHAVYDVLRALRSCTWFTQNAKFPSFWRASLESAFFEIQFVSLPFLVTSTIYRIGIRSRVKGELGWLIDTSKYLIALKYYQVGAIGSFPKG